MRNRAALPDSLAASLAVPLPRYTSYPTVPEWSERFSSDEHRAAIVRAGARAAEPLSLYVHLPFCHRRCTYCGCNVVVSNNRGKIDRYLDALELELTTLRRLLGDRGTIARVHFGGGTPTALDLEQLTRICDAIDQTFAIARDAERAIEIDPTVTSVEQLALLGKRGFGRLSVGVQDLDIAVQEAIGRPQSYRQTADAIEGARANGFGSVNLDLVYGLPRQTEAGFAKTLDAVLTLRPERVAAFAFAFVPALRPHQRRLPVADMPTPPQRLALRTIAAQRLEAAGYVAVGMDHWALPDDELAIALRERRLWRDFQGYTTQRTKETIAIGVSSISDVGGVYAQNALGLAEHRTSLQIDQLPTYKGMVRSADDERRRDIITQLMCNLWVDLADGGAEFAAERAALRPLVEAELVTLGASDVTITERGRPFLRNVASVFDTYLQRSRGRFSSAV